MPSQVYIIHFSQSQKNPTPKPQFLIENLTSTMRFADKACIVLTLGAAFGLKDRMIIPKSPALLEKWSSAVGSSALQVKPVSISFDPRKGSWQNILREVSGSREIDEDGFLFELLGP
ncbi:hypothetical protein OIU77_015709 [Salix suchowensis]|uniref:Uncharacterized protein n=1 Tax=Salix suchowensis TaxID=1278906 RepID=A0ABQ8ZHV6_9ROSI|nr:hypothetical protein OIU77_015709 [Salix suchowensis]